MDFRIWDTENRKYVDSLSGVDSYIIEENTGLKDEDGIFIYENDVWKRNKPLYHYWHNGKRIYWKSHDLGSILIYKDKNGKWSVENEEDCGSNEGFVIGTIHDVEWI